MKMQKRKIKNPDRFELSGQSVEKGHPKGWLFCIRSGIIKKGDKNAEKR